MMVFAYNIGNGLTAGLVLHPLFKIVAGRFRKVTLGGGILTLICLACYLFGPPH